MLTKPKKTFCRADLAHAPFRAENLKVSATLKIAIFPFLRFQRFQIGMLESFLLKKNQKKILFLSKDIGGKRFFLVNYLN